PRAAEGVRGVLEEAAGGAQEGPAVAGPNAGSAMRGLGPRALGRGCQLNCGNQPFSVATLAVTLPDRPVRMNGAPGSPRSRASKLQARLPSCRHRGASTTP